MRNTKGNLTKNQLLFRGGKDWPNTTQAEQRLRVNKIGKHATLVDTLCAMTGGNVYGGHDYGYYMDKTAQVHEIVANISAMRYNHNALAKSILGDLMKDIEALLDSYQTKNGEL